jgi:hypothetical protein
MSEITLTKTRIRAGIWEGVLTTTGSAPAIEVRLLDQVLPGVTLTAVPDRPGNWALRVPVPIEALNEGVQTFLICDKTSTETLAHFTIVTGVAMEDDLRAEIDLLRAELDLLKRAFRRHCVETAV